MQPMAKPTLKAEIKELYRRMRFERAKGRCEDCNAEHNRPHPRTGLKVRLIVAHLNKVWSDYRECNLSVKCQDCYNQWDMAREFQSTFNKKITRKNYNLDLFDNY
jgi:hypothetical protein